jgi:hypothetical protein
MPKKKLYSLNSLATECGRNFRTISRALESIRPDGKAPDGRPRWFLATAIQALADHERKTGRAASRTPPERYHPAVEAQIGAIEASGREVDKLLAQLRGEKSVERRREIVESGSAKCVGAHERALAASIGSAADAPLRRLFCDNMTSEITGEVLRLCEWHIIEAERAT